MTYIFDKEVIKAWEIEKDTKYAIPDPNDNLIEIYEIDTIKDALQLRAEKWESPEHKFEVLTPITPVNTVGTSAEIKKPLNVQNPNYTELLDNIRGLQKQSNDLKKNKKDLKGLKEVKNGNLEKAVDLVAINKKETLISEIEQKLHKSWKKFMEFIIKMCQTVSDPNSIIKVEIWKFEFLPDIRLIRFMLAKKEPKIDQELISLICSYLYRKYIEQ